MTAAPATAARSTSGTLSGRGEEPSADRTQVLVFVNRYLPGYKSGGPIQTIAGMVDHLGSELAFKVVTADRDAGDTVPYQSIRVDQWQEFGKAHVFYASEASQSWRHLRRILRSADFDVLYLNSFFHPVFTVRPLALAKLGLVPRRPVIVAPRGEFSPGALSIKGLKKRLFLTGARITGLYRDVLWQASSPEEAHEIRRQFGPDALILVAPNLRPLGLADDGAPAPRDEKRSGSLRAVFLSRISPKKNLLTALRALKEVRGDVTFDIYGPVSREGDRKYWKCCAAAIDELPPNVSVTYRGVVPHHEVQATLARYHLFVLPTLGENFGHAILDALQAGCPLLLSDQTPWRNLEARGVGWDLPLSDPSAFHSVLQRCVDMDQQEWKGWSERAAVFGREVVENAEVVKQNRQLFRFAKQLAT